MTLLPIVARELRVAARRPATFRFRLGMAGAALLVGLWMLAFREFRDTQEIGMVMFVVLSVVAFLYAGLIGLATTADCVSEEKRDGTLGLLFLTDLKGYDVVFGKLAATSLKAFYGTLAIFPVMAIPLLAGGVSAGDFGRVVVVVLNNMFFSLAVGLFASAACRDERTAAVVTFGIIVFLAAVLPIAGLILTEARHWNETEVLPWFFVPSPAFGCFVAFEEVARGSRMNLFPYTVGCVHVTAWLFLGLACWLVPRSWQDKPVAPSDSPWRAFYQQWRFGGPAFRDAFRARALDRNPYFWLAGRERVGPIYVWGTLGLFAILWSWGYYEMGRDWLDPAASMTTLFIIQGFLKIWLAVETSRRFGLDRRSGALELVLCSPLRVREILAGQRLAISRQFAGPAALVLGIDALLLWSVRRDPEATSACVAGMTVFVADLAALSWVGMWCGLRSRFTNRATALAILQVLVLPWLLFGLFATLLELGREFHVLTSQFWNWGENEMIPVWALLSIFNAAFFGFRARRRLRRDFRKVAAQKYEAPARRWWQRWRQAPEAGAEPGS